MNTTKRNYILMFLDPILFVNAMAFISVYAVIPNFLNDMGASTFQISLAGALVSIGSFISQPIFAQLAMRSPVKTITFSKLLFIQRIMFMVYVLLIPLLVSQYPGISIVLFLVCWGIFNFFVGCYSPFYMSVLSKVISENQRGRLQGFSAAIGNVLALGSAYLVGVLLKNVAFPYNYVWIFGIGTSILLLNSWIFASVKEKPEPVEKKPIQYFKYIKEIPHALKANKRYAVCVLGNSFIVISNIALSFYSLAALRLYEAGPEQIALFTGIGVMASVIGFSIFGIVGDRFGHDYVLMLSAVCSVMAAAAILSINGLIGVYLAFALSSLSTGGYTISCGVNIVNISPRGQVPLYISMNNMITLVASSIITILAGLVIDTFSFAPLFAFTGICGASGFMIFFTANRKARQGKESGSCAARSA